MSAAINLLLLFNDIEAPPVPPTGERRITDDNNIRITDSGDTRITD
jgi:hypothetical protein